MYYKINEDGEKVFSQCGSIKLGDVWVSNPTPEMIAEAGWIEYAPEEGTPTLDSVKAAKVDASNDFAESLKMVSLYGMDIWRSPAERDNYTSTLLSAQRLGQTDVSFMGKTLTIADAIHILDVVNVWAFQVTAVKEAHANAIQALATIEEVESYDFTGGYPEKIVIGS